jgi:hypothetical protein
MPQILCVPASDLTSYGTTQKWTLGSTYVEDDTGKEYKYVQILNTSATVAGAAGDVAGWGLAGADDFLAVLDVTDAATKPIGAGVVLGTVTGTAGTTYYGWLQTKGPFTALVDLAGTPSDGDALFLSTTDSTLTLSTAADDPVCAYADDDSAQLCIAAFN